MAAPAGCLPSFAVALAVLLPLATAAAAVATVWVRARLAAADAVWRVGLEELSWDAPVVVLGRGTFGLVVRAEVGDDYMYMPCIISKTLLKIAGTTLGL